MTIVQNFRFLKHISFPSFIDAYFQNNLPPKQNSDDKKKPTHSHFIYGYFWCTYHLLLSPFRLKKRKDGQYEIHTWRPQQILCAGAMAFGLFHFFVSGRTSLEKLRRNDPVSFFNVFANIFSIILKVNMLSGFWRKKEAFLNLANFASSSNFRQYNPYKMESIPTLTLLFAMYALVGFSRFFFGYSVVNLWDWSIPWFYRRTVAEARYTFFLTSDRGNFSTAPELSSITVTDTFLAVFVACSRLSRSLNGTFVDICILAHILVLWAPASAFASEVYKKLYIIRMNKKSPRTNLEDHEESFQEEIDATIKEFIALKNLSILVREAIGDSIAPFLGEALFYYAVHLDVVLLTPDILQRIVLSSYYISTVCILLFSAEIIRKMKWFKVWLCEENKVGMINSNQFTGLLDDLALDSVGVTACGMFTINYSSSLKFLGILMTYFIIRQQSVASATSEGLRI